MALLTEREWASKAAELRAGLREAWEQLADPESNLLDSLKLLQLFKHPSVHFTGRGRPANWKASDMDVLFALERMGLSKYHIHAGVLLRFQTVERWYLQEKLGERGDLRNNLLIRPQIGVKRVGYHRMPPPTVPFGTSTSANRENANQLLHNAFSKPCEQGIGANKRIEFPNHAVAADPYRYGRPTSAFDKTARFGQPTSARTPAADLINYKFGIEGTKGMEMAPERQYAPAEGTRHVSGRLPPPRPTSASIRLMETNRAKAANMGLDVQGHAALHATQVARPERPRPSTARL